VLLITLTVGPTGWPGTLLAADTTPSSPVSAGQDEVRAGRKLFLKNCAHCHGADARGDEGPDLHDLNKTDEHVAAIIKDGIKGEMPGFGAKFSDADIQALITYIRSLH
jgi:mono/diheme cytochrome c family protein